MSRQRAGHRLPSARRGLFLGVYIFYALTMDHSPVGMVRSVQCPRARTKKEIVMGRIVLAGLVLGLCASLAAPVLAQTNEACMLRCLDHLLYQTCQARCTKGAPPARASTPSRAAPPTNVPAATSMSPSPAAAPSVPPSSAQPAPTVPAPQPSALEPAVAQPALQPRVQPPAQPVANKAPPQPTAQATSQQSVKPSASPPRRVNQACVLRCLDHGRLDQQCQATCEQ